MKNIEKSQNWYGFLPKERSENGRWLLSGSCTRSVLFFFLICLRSYSSLFNVCDLLCSSSSAICFHVSHISYSISVSEVKMVNIPKARNTYCAKCNKHQKFKVIWVTVILSFDLFFLGHCGKCPRSIVVPVVQALFPFFWKIVECEHCCGPKMFDHIRILSLVQTSVGEPKFFVYGFTLSLNLAPALFGHFKPVDPDPKLKMAPGYGAVWKMRIRPVPKGVAN